MADLNTAWRRAEARIDRAWYAALLAAGGTILLGVMSISAEGALRPRDWLLFADAALVLGLAWGVARRSRVAAALLVAHLVLTVWAFLRAGSYGYAVVAVAVFGPLYVLGLAGTVEHARLRRAEQEEALRAFRPSV